MMSLRELSLCKNKKEILVLYTVNEEALSRFPRSVSYFVFEIMSSWEGHTSYINESCNLSFFFPIRYFLFRSYWIEARLEHVVFHSSSVKRLLTNVKENDRV